MSQELLTTRRGFAKWSAAVAGAAAFAGLVGCSSEPEPEVSDGGTTYEETGEWKIGGCLYNCSCGSSRCLVRVYSEDGVPLRVESDYDDPDTIGNPQRRACLRGYAQVSRMLSPARLKYPMKRKNWSPEAPNGELRGQDEWERITWDEALEIVATQTKKILDEYGPKSLLISGWDQTATNIHLHDPVICNFYALGAGLNPRWGTVSWGAWDMPSLFMAGYWAAAADSLSLLKSDLHLLFGCNWASNKGGNVTYHLDYARSQGAKVIILDPWLNQTAQMCADQWIPIRPGTDAALMLGMMYHWVENGLHKQDYLDKYCIGFDAEHMPEGAPAEDNFKDYLMGTYDGEPKNAGWAEKICGVPAETIKALAEEVAACDNVNFFGGQSITKIPAGDFIPQIFWTMVFMHGRLGSGGTFASWIGHNEHNYSSVKYAQPGANVDPTGNNPKSRFLPPVLLVTPMFAQIDPEDKEWDDIEYSECWQSILDGEYGRDSWPGGKRPLDIHMIYSGGRGNFLNQLPNANAGIKAYRKMDFVVAGTPFYDANAKYADIILPFAMSLEEGNFVWQYNSDTVFWMDRLQEPQYEAKPMYWVAEQLAVKLGLDPKVVIPHTDMERCYSSLAGSTYLKDSSTLERAPLITLTQEDIDAMGVQGTPQEGVVSFADFKAKGIWKPERTDGDALMYDPYKKFYEDPEANPLSTTSGKFEIYCPTLAGIVNACGFDTISPIGKWQYSDVQGIGAVTDEYPLLLWTPHSLRRGHSSNDDVISLREAFPQECFISVVDAEARGIKNGDPVLMTSPYGKVLRPAKVTPIVAPGAVALQEGAWMDIDEETGIDMAGNPNILQAPPAAGHGFQAWTATIVQVEKYDGPLELKPDKHRAVASLDSYI